MTEREYKKARRTVCILTAVIFLFLLFVLGVFLRFAFPKDNPELMPQTLVENLEQPYPLYFKLEDVSYTVPSGPDITALFRDLQKTKQQPTETEQWITLHFGELYEFYIYESGIVEGFDGYAATATKTGARYETDAYIYSNLKDLILTSGTVCDGNIGFFR